MPFFPEDDLIPTRVLPKLLTNHLGRQYLYYRVTSSTQDEVWQRIERGLNVTDLVVAAAAQREGRGRRGRCWTTFPRTALAFSFPVPVGLVRSSLHLPYQIARIVARVVREVTQVDGQVLFPNDVVRGNKKVAGVLVEQRGSWLVVGVGINLTTPYSLIPLSLQQRATSLVAKPLFAVDLRLVLFLRLLQAIEAVLFQPPLFTGSRREWLLVVP